jgi:GT2 family glycosyltransferase
MFSPLITIITVNYNQTALTLELLKSIREQSYKNIEIFVVDNASKINPEKEIFTQYPEVKFIRSEINLGFAGGNNLANPKVKGDYIFYINNDAEITEDCLEKLLKVFETEQNVGIISPLICYDKDIKVNGNELIQYAGCTRVNQFTARNSTIGSKEENENQFNLLSETGYIHGAAMLIDKKVIDNVGLMYDKFFLYYEELDWCERIRKGGYKIMVEPNAKIYHKESVTVGAMSTLKTYYLNRNRVLFMRRNFGFLALIGFVLFLIFFTIPKNTITYLLKGKWNHLAVFYKAILWNIIDFFIGKQINFNV